ncbi:glutathione-dependent formaldehyde dehydrogenase [Actinoalloteichus sp. AHMU CJ021]|uniref:zinc-dependent alcohol dehydrogenase n=1 Tax=Actinoalloteichus sp. AHMU CJ021 TaxID=2072503 RepID=UPI000CA0481E|nr:glutathione-dependent formaldehyde dehydrogenase [Actinoalloteichus sp. AHMU CJ021]
MRALTWHGPRSVHVDTVADPTIEQPTDAIIRVTASGLCGSDLHLYEHGLALAVKPGDILGHEPMGVVEEVGRSVHHIRPGDRVVVPFNISCGECFMCRRQLFAQCETTQNLGGRKGASLFGYTHLYGGVPGAQAEYLRVPQAHFGPIRVPEGVPDEALALLSDVLPTSWQAVEYADVPRGGSLAVFGLGPIGQMSARIALHRGAGRVLAVDPYPDRRAFAARAGIETIDPQDGDPVEQIRAGTAGRGADSVIDAVGMDSEGSVVDRVTQILKTKPDRLHALHQSLGAVRRGGTVSVSGVYAAWMPRFPLGDLFDRNVTLRWGQAHVRAWTDTLLDVLRDGDPLGAAELVSHQVPLRDAPEYYAAFAKKRPGVRKVLLRPHGHRGWASGARDGDRAVPRGGPSRRPGLGAGSPARETGPTSTQPGEEEPS